MLKAINRRLSSGSEGNSANQNGATRSSFARGLLFVAGACLVLFLALSPSLALRKASDDKLQYVPKLFDDLALSLKTYYLDPQRVQPRALMRKALSALENAVDEIYVEDSNPDKPIVSVHLNSKVSVHSLAGIDDLDDAVFMLKSLFGFIQKNYRGELGVGNIQYAVANGFLSGLDPHTLVFNPKEFQEFSVHIEGEIFGVGMYVGTRDGKLTVIQVLKGTPAEQAGFRKDDTITKINDESTINMTVTEAVNKIRGPRKSKLTLTVKRTSRSDPSKVETIPIDVYRDRVVIKSVESTLINDWEGPGVGAKDSPVGYVSVTNFDNHTTRSLREHLAKLKAANDDNSLSGLILDLRGNSGGLLRQAIEMSDLFLNKGDIVIQASQGQILHKDQADKQPTDEPDYPIVLLSDRGSASGAEIVIGALQKNDRGIVLGTRTFGKGSVQQLHRLESAQGAQLKITVSEYLIPGNISIQENGVVPDISAQPVTLPSDPTAGRINLFPRDRGLSEKDYDRHLISQFAKDEQPSFTMKYLHDPEKYDPDHDPFVTGDLQPTKDKLVGTALAFLGLMQDDYRRSVLLEKKKDKVEAIEARLFHEVVERLGSLEINWENGTNSETKNATLQIETKRIEEPSGDEEDPVPVKKLLVTASLTNQSDQPLYRVKGITHSDYFLYKNYEFLFGKVKPGETIERSVRMRLPYFPHPRNDLLEVQLSGDDDEVFLTQTSSVESKNIGRPRFAFKAGLFDNKTNQALTQLQPGVEASLRVKVKNVGDAPAHKGVVILRNSTGRQVFLERGRIEFTELEASHETEAELTFSVRSGKPVSEYEFELGVVDSYSNAAITRSVSVPAVGTGSPTFEDKLFQAPTVTAQLESDKGEPVLVTGDNVITLNAKMYSPTGVPFKYWVMHSTLGDRADFPDKILYSDSKGETELELSTRVYLDEGTNLFTLVAHDQDGLESRRNLVVRKTASVD